MDNVDRSWLRDLIDEDVDETDFKFQDKIPETAARQDMIWQVLDQFDLPDNTLFLFDPRRNPFLSTLDWRNSLVTEISKILIPNLPVISKWLSYLFLFFE